MARGRLQGSYHGRLEAPAVAAWEVGYNEGRFEGKINVATGGNAVNNVT